MAQASLLEMTREVVLYSGGVCPVLLAERWIRDRYRYICKKAMWSFKIGQGQFSTPLAYSTGTVTMTADSVTVTGSGTTFTSAMVGRQFKVGGFVFTIATYTSATSIDLDRAWKKATEVGSTYSILQAYITPADTDFQAFYSVLDPDNGWKLHLGWTAAQLDRMDARRSSAGTSLILAGRLPNSSNVQMYELWPHPTSQKHYPYMYEKLLADLSTSTDTPPKMIGSDMIVTGALADLARWPGSHEVRNPMYDPYFNQWKNREGEFRDKLNEALREDQSLLLTDLEFQHNLRYAPLDANYMQKSAHPAF